MSKPAKRVKWVAGYLALCLLMYQLFGWLGPLILALAGIIGGIVSIFINRKGRRDQHRPLP